MCSCVYVTVYDCPAPRYLNRYVKEEACIKWYDLGLELLEPEDGGKLNVILHSNHRDLRECCRQMFQLWLQNCPDATWEHLIQALREVRLNRLASKIYHMLQRAESMLVIDRIGQVNSQFIVTTHMDF